MPTTLLLTCPTPQIFRSSYGPAMKMSAGIICFTLLPNNEKKFTGCDERKTNFDFTHFYDFLTNQPYYTKTITNKPKILILIVEKIRKNEIDCSHLVNNLIFFVIVTDIYYQLLDFFADF